MPPADPPSVGLPDELAQTVQDLVTQGQAQFNAGAFWEAHEAWEEGWLSLREEGFAELADHLQGLILVTAGFENLSRGKPEGARVQLAKGLVRLRASPELAGALGVVQAQAFREAVLDILLEVLAEKRDHIDELEHPIPELALGP